MDWKKIAHSVICLLVVCSILLTMAPVKADAVVLETTLGIGVAACLILMSAGVVFNPQTVEDINAISQSFQTHMTQWGAENGKQTEVQEWLDSIVIINPFGAPGDDDDDGWESPNDKKVKLARGILAGISSWIASVALGRIEIEKEAETPVSEGFTCSVVGYKNENTPFNSFTYSFSDYSSELISMIESLGVNSKVAIIAIDNSSPYYLSGIYFDENGQFRCGLFENPLSVLNASSFGVFALSDLKYIGDPSLLGSIPIFYSCSYAEQFSDFLTSNVYAFDFGTVPVMGTNSSGYSCESFTFHYKDSSSTTWRGTTSYCFPGIYNWGPACYAIPHADYITWISSDGEYLTPSLVGDIPSDLQEGNITEEDIPLADIDYSQVLPVGQTYLESIQSLATQLETGTLTYEDYLDMTKVETSTDTDTDTGSDTDNGTSSDSISNVGADTFWEKLLSVITQPFEWLGNFLVNGLLNGIKSIFVPSEDFITDKVDYLLSNFSFAGSIVGLIHAFTDGLNNIETEPPVIYINLGDSKGSYTLGGTVPFIDMHWYAEYKPTVDTLLSAFLWLVFLWRVFVKLPGIVSGMPGDFVMDGLSQIGLDEHLPARNADYEKQRISNRESVRKGSK